VNHLELGRKIKDARKLCGLSQQRAAKAAGISQPLWHMTETGERTPSPENLAAMGHVVGLAIEVSTTYRVRRMPRKIITVK
jgi:transcriptional regulator with XRE-family HTH domain